MELKKNGDLVYASIKMFSSQELTQFKRFLKFEYNKPAPFLKITNLASKLAIEWSFGESFPEKKLKQNCDEDIVKNFVKYKYKLKQSVENYVNYLGTSEQSKSTSIHCFFRKAFFINYHYFYKLGLYHIAHQEMENLAKEAFEVGHYDFSDVLYRNLNHFSTYAFANALDAIEENKRIYAILLERNATVNYHTEIIFYLQLFFNATNLYIKDLDVINEEILAFEKIEKKDFQPIITLNHLLAEAFLSTSKNDFHRDLEINMEIVEFYKIHKDLPPSIKRHNFSVIYNASLAARRLKNEELSKKFLDEAAIFLEETTDLEIKFRKHYYYFLLGGRLDHNIFFESDTSLLLNSLNKIKEAMENGEIKLSKVQVWNKISCDTMCYYLAEKFETSYEISHLHCTEDNFDLMTFVCHILTQYHLFDADFLSYSYRNSVRHIETKKKYSDKDIAELKTIMSLLKKAKVKKDEKLKKDIEASILKFRNDGFFFIHERIAEVFIKNF